MEKETKENVNNVNKMDKQTLKQTETRQNRGSNTASERAQQHVLPIQTFPTQIYTPH